MNHSIEPTPAAGAAVAVAGSEAMHVGGAGRHRLPYIDNLRVMLTALVVIHHAAVTYGNIPLWYYTEPARDRSGRVLDVLVVLDQTFFMGFFFLVSGLFVPSSYDRKGPRAFLHDRFVRLGIPLAVFAIVLRPLLSIPVLAGKRARTSAQSAGLGFWKFFWKTWNPGPLWFVEVLLVFCLLYVLARRLGSRLPQAAPTEATHRPPPSTLRAAIAGYSLVLAAVTLVWRRAVPVGQFWPIVGLPTPAYLPQYASLFAVGVLAARRGWADALPASIGWFGLAQSMGATMAVVPIALVARRAFAGTPRLWASLLFGAWESFFAVGVIVALCVLFQRKFNSQGPFGRMLTDHCYTVYIIHPMVLVAVGYGLRWLHAIAVVKFAALVALGLPLCWLSACAVRSLPYAKRVL